MVYRLRFPDNKYFTYQTWTEAYLASIQYRAKYPGKPLKIEYIDAEY